MEQDGLIFIASIGNQFNPSVEFALSTAPSFRSYSQLNWNE